MKILFDQQIFSFQNYGGISRYFYELAKDIRKTKNVVIVEGKYSNNVYLPKIKSDVVNVFPHLNFPYKNNLLFWLNRYLGDRFLNNKDFDVLHATYYDPYFLKAIRGKPYVITVYDMIHEIFAKEYQDLDNDTTENKKLTVFSANQIIAISENTKKDLISLYDLPKERIDVIYLGNPLEGVKPISINGLPQKYLLFVGNRLGYKNFTYFVKSLAPIIKNDSALFLICAGGGKFSSTEKSLLSELGIQDRVSYFSFKNDNELAFIYKNALAYVLPSLYEGFGLTALEAFSMGCPIVASNTSSIPEVCGKAAIYINPKSASSIRNGLRKVLYNKELRNRLIKRGFVELKRFSWDKTAKETLKVYEKVLKLDNK